MKIRTGARAAAVLLALALVTGCTTSRLKVAVDAEQVAQSALIAVRIADQDLYDRGQITVEKHREHQAALLRAFDLHEQAVKATLLATDAAPVSAAEYAAKIQEAWLIVQAVFADFPKSPERDKATAVLAKGIF
jgi:hypothetical protein